MLFSALLTLFIVVPIIELALLLRVGQYLGLAGTVLLVVLTGVAGATLARWQGIHLLGRIHRDLANDVVPAPRLVDGVMILAAGLLLITPGLLTDAVGFLLLVPAFRAWLKKYLREQLRRRFDQDVIEIHYDE